MESAARQAGSTRCSAPDRTSSRQTYAGKATMPRPAIAACLSPAISSLKSLGVRCTTTSAVGSLEWRSRQAGATLERQSDANRFLPAASRAALLKLEVQFANDPETNSADFLLRR